MAAMTVRNVLKRIFLVGAPLLVSRMSQYLMTLADTAMVGRLGAESLAGISIGATTTWCLFVFVWPVSVGVQAIAARRFGRNESLNEDGSEGSPMPLLPVLGAGLAFTAVSSILALGLSSLAHPVFSVVLEDPEVAESALSYLKFTRWAVPFVGLGAIVQGFMNSMRRTRGVMVITVIANIINVFLNWVFIFGRLGAPRMGLAGAGMATLISQAFQALALWLLVLLLPSLEEYRKEKSRPDAQLIRRLTHLCLPIAVQNGAALFIMLIFDTMVENIGAVYLAVTQIVFSFFRINKTLVGSFARGAGILAGNALGAGDSEGAKLVARVQQGLGVVIGLLVMVMVLTIPAALISIFTDDPQVLSIGVPVMRFFAAFYLVEISAFSLEVIFQSVGWSRFVLFSEFTTNVVFILGTSLLLMRFTSLGIWGAWLGFALYQLGHAAILTVGWASGRWIHVKVEG